MKKNKIKVFLSFIILIIFLFGGFYLYNNYFKGNHSNIITHKRKEKPKLKIIDETSNSRVFAVMINNNHDAWPHAGLQDAFLNYEIIVEGGITRIMSLFKDKDTEKIGSVRSARHYFLDYALENDAIYVHHGRSPKALQDIKFYDIDDIEGLYDSDGFWRDETLDVAYEHTSFTNISKIKKVSKDKNYRMVTDEKPLLNYSIKEVKLNDFENVEKADEVIIEYSNYHTTQFKYDKEKKVYNIYMNDVPHVDAITNKQYYTKNIITYKIENWSIDSSDRQEIDNIGTGEGYYISNGYAVPIKWQKISRDSKTKYMYNNGKEIDVNDGVTWIEIQPENKDIYIKSNEDNSKTNNNTNID